MTDYLLAAWSAAADREGLSRRRYAELALRAYLAAYDGDRAERLAAQLQLATMADTLAASSVGEPGEGWGGVKTEVVTMRIADDLVGVTADAAAAVGLSTASYLRRALACAVEGDAEAEAERLASAPDRLASAREALGLDAAPMPSHLVANADRRQMVMT